MEMSIVMQQDDAFGEFGTEFQAMTGAQTSIILPGPVLVRFLCLLDCLKRPQILTIHLCQIVTCRRLVANEFYEGGIC
jgi:hypothetical protein